MLDMDARRSKDVLSKPEPGAKHLARRNWLSNRVFPTYGAILDARLATG